MGKNSRKYGLKTTINAIEIEGKLSNNYSLIVFEGLNAGRLKIHLSSF
jgi:hypothetical protein